MLNLSPDVRNKRGDSRDPTFCRGTWEDDHRHVDGRRLGKVVVGHPLMTLQYFGFFYYILRAIEYLRANFKVFFKIRTTTLCVA